ncbi:MAG: hypothetical protein ACLQBB_03820 [Solirubrobacteraceae bacterium]
MLTVRFHRLQRELSGLLLGLRSRIQLGLGVLGALRVQPVGPPASSGAAARDGSLTGVGCDRRVLLSAVDENGAGHDAAGHGAEAVHAPAAGHTAHAVTEGEPLETDAEAAAPRPQNTEEFLAVVPEGVRSELEAGDRYEQPLLPSIPVGVSDYPAPATWASDWRRLAPRDSEAFQDSLRDPKTAKADELNRVVKTMLNLGGPRRQ